MSDGMSPALTGAALGVVLAIAIGLGTSTPDRVVAERALRAEGWTGVRVVDSGYLSAAWFCGRDDGSWFQVMATNRAGDRAEALVCCRAVTSWCSVHVR